MFADAACQAPRKYVKTLGVLAALTSALMSGGCAQIGGDEGGGLISMLQEGSQEPTPAGAFEQNPRAVAEIAAKDYTSNPSNLEKALAYARSLKALGEKRQALAVLQQAAFLHSTDRRLASEYGRLALELDQVSVAKKMLEAADDPAVPDWRVIMARGTVAAKEGRYREATGFYERALALAPDHPSVLSNLALAYTMSGDAAKGEELLRRASVTDGQNPKIRQNLALVLGLQGKYDEATKVAAVDLPADKAQENAELLRKIVKLEPKSSAMPAALPVGVWDTQVSEVDASTKLAAASAASPSSVVKSVWAPETSTVTVSKH